MGLGIKKGGGRLNNVDGTITGYEFTTRPAGGKPKDTSKWVYLVVSIKQDGVKDEITQHFFIGAEEEFEISKDGQSIVAGEDNIVLGASSGAFMQSVLDAGFPVDELPDTENGEDLELSNIVDKRFRFTQVPDDARTKKEGGPRKVKDKKTGKMREYPWTLTVVSAYYEADEKPSKSNGKAAGKSAGKSKAVEMDEECGDVLKAVLAEADDNELPYKKLSVALTRKFLKIKVENDKDAMKDRILDEEFLGTEDGWEYDSKKQMVSASA
jgi:hypothetical protein